MNTENLDGLKDLLEGELKRIEATAEQRNSASATVELDQQAVGRLSRMDAMQQQAMAKAEARRAKARIGLIKSALAKIADGDYGLCEECDEPIALGRLKVDPSARLCITCAEKADG